MTAPNDPTSISECLVQRGAAIEQAKTRLETDFKALFRKWRERLVGQATGMVLSLFDVAASEIVVAATEGRRSTRAYAVFECRGRALERDQMAPTAMRIRDILLAERIDTSVAYGTDRDLDGPVYRIVFTQRW